MLPPMRFVTPAVCVNAGKVIVPLDRTPLVKMRLPLPVHVPFSNPNCGTVRLMLLFTVPAVTLIVPPGDVDVPLLSRYVPPPKSRKPLLVIVPDDVPPPARLRIAFEAIVSAPL